MEETLSFSGKKESLPLIQEGKYEVTLNMEWATTKNGDPYIKIVYKIRTECEQNEKGRLVFDAIYKSKKTGKYPDAKINAILSAIPNARLDFKDYDELMQYVNGANMIIEVETEKADPSNALTQDRSAVKFWSNEPTIAGPTFAPAPGPVEVENVAEVTNGNELPF